MPNGQPEKKKLTDAQIIALIAGALAMEKSPQATAATLSPLISVPVKTLLAVLIIAMSRPVKYGITVIPSASATAESQALEAHYRAMYVLNATKRLAAGGSIDAEQKFFNQHMEATSKRRGAANAVDKARARYGDELGWYAKMDNRTSEECRQANGKNFSATRLPAIGWPGAVHPNCRCKPGRKHATSQTVYGIKMTKVA